MHRAVYRIASGARTVIQTLVLTVSVLTSTVTSTANGPVRTRSSAYHHSSTIIWAHQFHRHLWPHSSGPSRGWGRGVSYPGPRDVWRAPPSARNFKNTPECTILKRKIQKFSPQRGPVKMFGGQARMFPRASLWLSTGLTLLPSITLSFFIFFGPAVSGLTALTVFLVLRGFRKRFWPELKTALPNFFSLRCWQVCCNPINAAKLLLCAIYERHILCRSE